MTREDIKRVLKILSINYPSTYKNMCKQEKIAQINNYEMFFGEYPVDVVVHALKYYVRTNKYPPTVAGLQEQINLLIEKDPDLDLWAEISSAIADGIYHSQERFRELPVACQSFIGSPQALRDLAQTESGIVNTVVKGQFLKNIDDIKKKEIMQGLLSQEMKASLNSGRKKELGERNATNTEKIYSTGRKKRD